MENAILSLLELEPTLDQLQAIHNFVKIYGDKKQKRKVFLLKGYAGTGKTFLVSSIIKYFSTQNTNTVLLAPTGRAAKVMSSYANKEAYTIHRFIYGIETDKEGVSRYIKKPNVFSNTVFFVDEASMLQDEMNSSLLRDLISYIHDKENNLLVLIGDEAQLPPVGSDNSDALSASYLLRNYQLNVEESMLRAVVRQKEGSGILHNATAIRNAIENATVPRLTTKEFSDTYTMDGSKLEDGLRYAIQKYGIENTLVICNANWQCLSYNRLIKTNLLYHEELFEPGDRLMVVKNNYSLEVSDKSKMSFIANGDIAVLKYVNSTQERFGFNFSQAGLLFPDYSETKALEFKVLLDTLMSKAPALDADQSKALYQAVVEHWQIHNTEGNIWAKVKKDEYLNALQVKHAYAITCHKSQGGQWSAVFIDGSHLKEETMTKAMYRWLYTAITRATEEVFLLNFPKFLFE